MTSDNSRLDLSVVVPCFNEEFNVPELTERVLAALEAGQLSGELLLVDDGSTDATPAVIRRQVAAFPGRVMGLFHAANAGMAGAWRTGVDAARGANVAVLDADLQYQPEDLLRLYRALVDQSVDVVQGWRSSVGRERGQRYQLSRGFNVLLNAAFGMRLRDNKSGFICCAKEVMQDLLTYQGRYYYWQSFIMVAAHAKGYSYHEIETLFEPRKQGKSFIDGAAYLTSARCVADLGKAIWEYRLHPKPHDAASQILGARGARVEAGTTRSERVGAKGRRELRQLGADVARHYRSLNATQWLSAEQIAELQVVKLRRLIRHAYRSVPYYRARMQELGLRPDDVRDPETLRQLPFLTRDDVRKHLHFDLLQEKVSHANLEKVSTSGRSGEPMVSYVDSDQLSFRRAATLRALEWTGYRLGEPVVRLWQQVVPRSEAHLQSRLDEPWLRNCTLLPVFEITEQRLEEMRKHLEARRPAVVEGPTEALHMLAVYLQAHGGLCKSPRAVMTGGQTLSLEARATIANAFGAKVFDHYGSRELWPIACECEGESGHLVTAEGFIVELLVDGRPAEPGEVGEVVVTDIASFCMPLIRYRTGDWARCLGRDEASKRALQRIGEIQGRPPSIVYGTGDHRVPGSFFAHTLQEYDYAVRRYQIRQTSPGSIQFRIVRGRRFSDETLNEINVLIRRHLGNGLHIDVEMTDLDSLADEPACVSDVDPEQARSA